MTPAGSIPRELLRLQRPALFAAIGGAILLVLGMSFGPAQFFRAYLFAWLFCLGLSLGSLALVMLGHLVAGEWAWLIRRFGEAAAMNLPLLAFLFLPILLGLKYLFPWADPNLVANDHIMHHRAGYMNASWFTMRAVIYFVIWIAMAVMMRRFSLAHERDGNTDHLRNAQRIAAPGLVVYVITMTLAAIDWVLSREPHWFSHIIGLLIVVGQAAAALAMILYVLSKVAGRDPVAQYVNKKQLNDLGNLMLTLVILWAYMSFAQLLIIWMGNTKEGVTWYIQRGMGSAPNGWRWIALLLIAFHFFVPFFILLIRENKRQARILGSVAGLVLLMRVLDVYWWIAPAGWFTGHAANVPVHGTFAPQDEIKELIFGRPSLMDIPAILTLGGIWLALFVRNLKGKPLLARGGPPPATDHDLDESGHVAVPKVHGAH